MMKTLTLTRYFEANSATWGKLQGEGFEAETMELPWKNNSPGESCIPTGEYTCRRDTEGAHKYYRLEKVPGRSHIEIHPANYPHQLKGCIALGERVSTDCKSLIMSATAMQNLMEHTGGADFTLKIVYATERGDGL